MRKQWLVAATMFGMLGCGGDTTQEDLEAVEQSARAALYAPSGSNLDFVGLYRLKNQATNECLNHDLSFGPCGEGQAETPDKVAVYRGVDGHYMVCAPTPPKLKTRKECARWEAVSTGADFTFIQFGSSGSPKTDTDPSDDFIEVCNLEKEALTFESKCMGSPLFASADAYGDLTVGGVCHHDNKRVCVSSQVLSRKAEGQTSFYRTIGNIKAVATATPGEYLLRGAESNHPQYPWYRRDTGGFLGNGDNEKANNYHWVPLYIPDPDAPLAKRIDTPVAAPKAATCTLTSKKTSTRVELNWTSTSNALSCLMTIDGKVRSADSKCKGTLSLGALAGGPGHTAKLFVAGPTGTRSCQVSFTEP